MGFFQWLKDELGIVQDQHIVLSQEEAQQKHDEFMARQSQESQNNHAEISSTPPDSAQPQI